MNRVGSTCKQVGCPGASFDGTGFCEKHIHLYQSFVKSQPRNPIYNTSKWKKLRKHMLMQSPICNRCKKLPSNVVHHLREARVFPELAFEESNLEALCSSCHNRESQREGMKGKKLINI